MKLIECVPNFSEGRDIRIVHAVRDRIAAVPGVSILHVTADASHNRSVITFVAPADVIVDAAFAAIRAARDHIDLNLHEGVHPRIGAADVVPFVPLDGATMDDCVAVARELGARVGTELEIPVYLYERAATHPARSNLADVRRGGFETLRDVIEADPGRAPDFGPRRVHPTFGAVAIGARPFLVAFNVYIGGAEQLPTAKAVARAVRESDGGLRSVKALGLLVDGQAQVSMNLVDMETTTLAVAFDAVRRETMARGGEVTWSEIIGLVPERITFDVAEQALRLREPLAGHVLERALLEKRARSQSIHDYLESVGSGDPFPGGGSAAGVTAALAAALTRMVATLTIGRDKYASVDAEMRDVAARAHAAALQLESLAADDAEAYARVTDARRLPAGNALETELRQRAISAALIRASEVPLRIARLTTDVAHWSETVATHGNVNAISDAGVAALLAGAACRAAAYNVRINARTLAAMGSSDRATELVHHALASVQAADAVVAAVTRLVDARM